MKPKKPYKLTLSKLEYLSSVDSPAQGEGARALLVKSDDAFEMRAKVSKLDDALGLVFGYAFSSSLDGGKTPHVDYQDDAIDPDFLKTVTAFLEAGGPTDVNHDFDDDGKIVFAWPLLPEINEAMGIKSDTVGLAVAVKPSAETYAKFKSGELKGFSIAGTGVRQPLEQAKRKSVHLHHGRTSVIKSTLYTNEVDGHQHEVSVCEDGTLWVRYATATGAEHSHSHGIVFENGVLVILADSGHTHELAEGQPGIAIVPADAIVVVQARNDRAVASGAASKSTRSRTAIEPVSTQEDPMSQAPDLSKQLADLTKRNERLERIAKMSGAHKAHFDTLSGEDADAFLAKSAADRDAVIAKALADDPIEVEFNGQAYRKSAGPAVIGLAKAAKAQADIVTKQAEAIEKAAIRKDASQLFSGMPGTDDTHDFVVGALRKFGTPEQVGAAFETFNGMRKTSVIGKAAPGVNPGSDPQPSSGDAELRKAVEEYQKTNNIPVYEVAFVKAIEKDPKVRKLYEESLS